MLLFIILGSLRAVIPRFGSMLLLKLGHRNQPVTRLRGTIFLALPAVLVLCRGKYLLGSGTGGCRRVGPRTCMNVESVELDIDVPQTDAAYGKLSR